MKNRIVVRKVDSRSGGDREDVRREVFVLLQDLRVCRGPREGGGTGYRIEPDNDAREVLALGIGERYDCR